MKTMQGASGSACGKQVPGVAFALAVAQVEVQWLVARKRRGRDLAGSVQHRAVGHCGDVVVRGVALGLAEHGPSFVDRLMLWPVCTNP